MRAIVLSTLLAVTLVSAAAAQTLPLDRPATGYTLFNRPGATLQQHQDDIQGCATGVAAMTPPPGSQLYDPVAANPGYYNQTYGAGGAIIGSLVVAGLQAQNDRNARNRATAANYQNCMVARGWRLVRLPTSVGRQLAGLGRERLLERLAPMIAAEQPEGEILRVFTNELAQLQPWATTAPERGRAVSVSLRALPEQPNDDEPIRASGDAVTQASAPVSLSPIEDVSSIANDASLVVVTLIGSERSLTFIRDGEEGEAPVAFEVFVSKKLQGEEAVGTFIFAAPAGRWRISHISNVSLCVGAPAFEVGASEIVFAGAFGESGFSPNPSLAPAQQALAPLPDLATRLRPAAYVNGNTSECSRAALLYAYEIPGAPFAEGYQWGSRALVQGAPNSTSQ